MNTTEQFYQYAKEQEKLLDEFIKVHKQYELTVRLLNKQVEEYMKKGNICTQKRYNTDIPKGEGYFTTTSIALQSTPSYFNQNYATIVAAQELFIERLVREHQRLFGSFKIFTSLPKPVDKMLNLDLYKTEDVVKWIEEEKSGVGIQNRFSFSHYRNLSVSKKTVTLHLLSWDKEEFGGERIYSPSNYEELFGALHFVEFGNGEYYEMYRELIDDIEDMTITDIKKPLMIPNSEKVESIRFYINGRIDVRFVDEETATQFFQFVSKEKRQNA